MPGYSSEPYLRPPPRRRVCAGGDPSLARGRRRGQRFSGTQFSRACARKVGLITSAVRCAGGRKCRVPFHPTFVRELAVSPGAASTLTGVFLELPAGALSDLLGRRRLLVAGALVFATLPFTYLAVSTLAWLVILRFLHGSATAIFGPVASASLSDIAPAERRGGWLSAYSTAQGTGRVARCCSPTSISKRAPSTTRTSLRM